jgi:hypothetical protein
MGSHTLLFLTVAMLNTTDFVLCMLVVQSPRRQYARGGRNEHFRWTLEFSTWMVLAARLWPVWYENRLTLRGAFNSKFSTSSFIEIDFDGLILGMIVFKSSKLGRRFSFPFRVESMFVEFF